VVADIGVVCVVCAHSGDRAIGFGTHGSPFGAPCCGTNYPLCLSPATHVFMNTILHHFLSGRQVRWAYVAPVATALVIDALGGPWGLLSVSVQPNVPHSHQKPAAAASTIATTSNSRTVHAPPAANAPVVVAAAVSPRQDPAPVLSLGAAPQGRAPIMTTATASVSSGWGACVLAALLMFFALLDAMPIIIVSGASSALALPLHRGPPTPSSTAYHRLDPVSSGSWTVQVELFLRACWAERNSRHILIFLSANFTFMFVEFVYGLTSNSLSLVSDAGHMLLDCMGLVIGLLAAYIARLKPTGTFTYGFGRFEVLAGFINGVFLLFVAYFVAIEAIERVATPPTVHGDQLILVAVCGFIVNMVGLALFHQHAHGGSGGGSACSGHDHDHGHSHGGHGHNHNMMAIYIHVLADALGSLGVIVSSTLIHFFGWMILDPICSLLISALILMSVWPLVCFFKYIYIYSTCMKILYERIYLTIFFSAIAIIVIRA
jgi:cation diffusion facilitator family transporter